ncbi:MAG: nucleotidyltransferase family protein [Acidobacteriota bacterium]
MSRATVSDPVVSGVVLAAGASRRFGRPKQLASWCGQPLVVRAAELLIAAPSVRSVQVVVGSHGQEVAAALVHLEVEIVHHPGWSAGQASSLAAAVDALPSAAGALVIVPCDQPLLAVTDIERLIAALAPTAEAAACDRDGILGTPAVFRRDLFPRLRSLGGDRGARDLLNGGSLAVAAVPLSAAAAADVDTPADFARLPASSGER